VPPHGAQAGAWCLLIHDKDASLSLSLSLVPPQVIIHAKERARRVRVYQEAPGFCPAPRVVTSYMQTGSACADPRWYSESASNHRRERIVPFEL
jgi:hypothetical protein